MWKAFIVHGCNIAALDRLQSHKMFDIKTQTQSFGTQKITLREKLIYNFFNCTKFNKKAEDISLIDNTKF